MGLLGWIGLGGDGGKQGDRLSGAVGDGQPVQVEPVCASGRVFHPPSDMKRSQERPPLYWEALLRRAVSSEMRGIQRMCGERGVVTGVARAVSRTGCAVTAVVPVCGGAKPGAWAV